MGYSGAAQGYSVAPPAGSYNFEDEPPLLEELGVNIHHIISKARAVINPFSSYEESFADEADMAGPLAFCLLLGRVDEGTILRRSSVMNAESFLEITGIFLMLSRKSQFGVIYGQAIIACTSIYLVFNLMSSRGIDLYRSTRLVTFSLTFWRSKS